MTWGAADGKIMAPRRVEVHCEWTAAVILRCFKVESDCRLMGRGRQMAHGDKYPQN